MTVWTELAVIKKLDEGWTLSGDMASEASFGLICPTGQSPSALPAIPVDLVRRLSKIGILSPEPQHGKKYMYRRSPPLDESAKTSKARV